MRTASSAGPIVGASVFLLVLAWQVSPGRRLEASSPLVVMRVDNGRADKADSVAADGSGSVYVGGMADGGSSTFTVVKHGPQGSLEWVARYGALQGEFGGDALAVAVDAAGNTYAAGYIIRALSFLGSNVDSLVVSYDPNGLQRWVRRVNGPGDGFDAATAVVVDPSGAVYVGGFSGVGNDFDWTVVKYSSTGTPLWERRHQGLAQADDRIVRMALDSAGSLIVLGYTSNVGVGLAKDITTIKYSPQGDRLWAATFSESAASDEMPAALAVDAGGNVYVTGETVATTNPELEHVPLTLKYDSNGSLVFELRGDGAGGTSIAVDAAGSIVVSGASQREGGNPGVTAAAKFTSAGQQAWLVPLETPSLVAVEPGGNVYLVGNIPSSAGSLQSDYLTLKLDQNGGQIWRHRFVARGRANDRTLDHSGNLFVTGYAEGGSSTDMLTLRFAPDFAPGLDAPSAPGALVATGGSKQITLRWRDDSTTESGFRIERCQGAGCTNFIEIAQAAANATGFTNTGLAKKTAYSYRVRAFNAAGNSAFSNVASAQTAK